MTKTIGIVGGMGPLATADLFTKIIHRTKAAKDQDHIHVLIDSNPAVPDRTAAILHGGEDPTPILLQSCKNLEAMGADLLLMACNTAHYFYDRLQPALHIPMLHMPRETAHAARKMGYQKVALLATDGTVQSGVYGQAFAQSGVELLLPDPAGQKAVMSLIYDCVKAGLPRFDTGPVVDAIRRLQAAGAQAMVLGCTELPLAFQQFDLPGNPLDPTEVLARRAVEEAGGQLA